MDKELMARLSRRGNRYDDGAMMHGELINPDGPAAIACIEDLTAKAEALAEALRPFSRIEPSGFYAEDGSEAEAYIAVLAGPADGEFTGEDLATARAALKAWEK